MRFRLVLHMGIVLSGIASPLRATEPVATPVTSITFPSGFQVERLRSAQKDEDSWISMTFDDRGRIIIGLDREGLARVTLHEKPEKIKFEILDKTFKHCRGVLYAHDSLYVSATNTKAFYRLKDTNGDDQFDDVKLIRKLDYRSRYGHGSNQIVLGPDKMIYLVVGNDVSLPERISPTSPYRDPQNDHLLPNPHDAGHDNRVGVILRFDPAGENCEVLAGGFRNQVDIAFNSDGEMFTYDADMEWDVGQPWYRPTRVNHVVSAGEYGWRWGTGKWPVYFADSLPTTLNTGLGSPTGMIFGTKSKFPERYRKAMFMADWQNGRILLVDLVPKGATYECEYQVFLEGGPLNVCDMEFGPDGALYFITGGRGSQSGLYRVTAKQTGEFHKPAPIISRQQQKEAQQARKIRLQLGTYHQKRDADAIDTAWPHLHSTDRWLRFAAMRALENQPVDQWRERTLSETKPTAAITALLALCRQGDKNDFEPVFTALNRIQTNKLSHEQLLTLLRAYQLCFIRLGKPSKTQGLLLVKRLSRFYPHQSTAANHLLGELLIYLQDGKAVDKTLALLSENHSQEEQIRAAMLIRHVKQELTLSQKLIFLNWLIRARSYRNGKLIISRIINLRDDFLTTLSQDDKTALQNQIEKVQQELPAAPSLPARPFVKQWGWSDLEPHLAAVEQGRSYQNGKQALLTANCLKCHSMSGTGAQIGPDLTTLGKRFDTRKILESILEPSKVMDPKYRYTVYVLENGKVVTGRPLAVLSKTINVETDPLKMTTIEILRAEIAESVQSNTSPMPKGLLNSLKREEILDLLAYLKAGGNPDAKVFQK